MKPKLIKPQKTAPAAKPKASIKAAKATQQFFKQLPGKVFMQHYRLTEIVLIILAALVALLVMFAITTVEAPSEPAAATTRPTGLAIEELQRFQARQEERQVEQNSPLALPEADIL